MGRLTGSPRPGPVAPAAGAGGTAALGAAVRAQKGLVAVLLAVSAVGWWWSTRQMRGMDAGPWSPLGSFGWFLTVWVVMMAAMMFPSVSPTVALYARMSRTRGSSAAFVGGYLTTWAGAGVVAFVVGQLAATLVPGLGWSHGGRWLTGATLLFAAVYEVTPLKDACLGRCRSPLGQLLGSWSDGWSGALRMGMRNGAWCVGCCWALMASLFALGVMNALWMAVVAGGIAVEKVLPWRRTATWGTALVLLGLGVLVLTVPDLAGPPPGPMPMTPGA